MSMNKGTMDLAESSSIDIGSLPDGDAQSTHNIAILNGSTVEQVPLSQVEDITLHTGLRKGWILSVASTTTINITEGNAIRVNRNPIAEESVVTRTQKSEELGISDTNLGESLSHIFRDTAGVTTVEQDPPMTLADVFDRYYLGSVLHVGGIIVSVVPNPIIAHGSTATEMANLVFGGGTVLSGAIVSPNGANLKVNITSSILRQAGRGGVGSNTPNEVEEPGQFPVPVGGMFLSFVDGSDNLIGINTVNDIDPTQINTGGLGTLEDVGNNNFSIIRFFLAAGTGDVIVYYGTTAYNTLNDALITPETTFSEHPDTRDISFIAELIIKKEVTDLAAAIAGGTEAVFRPERIRVTT